MQTLPAFGEDERGTHKVSLDPEFVGVTVAHYRLFTPLATPIRRRNAANEEKCFLELHKKWMVGRLSHISVGKR